MDDVIKRLIEVDAKCSKEVETAKEKKLDAQNSTSTKRDEIYKEYLDKQQDTINEHKEVLLDKNKEEVSKQEEAYNESLKNMEALYSKEKDNWVDQIVKRCIKE
ncbi:MAG: hypothetical protein PHH04_07345 [Thomasclavelia sp.]|nr:hypothetical protein [Thomasclavelia sp.]